MSETIKSIDALASQLRENNEFPCTSSEGRCMDKGWPKTSRKLCPSCSAYWHLCEAMRALDEARKEAAIMDAEITYYAGGSNYYGLGPSQDVAVDQFHRAGGTGKPKVYRLPPGARDIQVNGIDGQVTWKPAKGREGQKWEQVR